MLPGLGGVDKWKLGAARRDDGISSEKQCRRQRLFAAIDLKYLINNASIYQVFPVRENVAEIAVLKPSARHARRHRSASSPWEATVRSFGVV